MTIGLDIVAVLRGRVEGMPQDIERTGLNAVLKHIEVAVSHRERGAKFEDDNAFTDAVYRCSQAYEGSLREAYRVIADQDPARVTSHSIERYVQTHALLKERVLTQMSRYRVEWRNPSTHDHRIDFDEDEALLAIVTVTAFAIVLLDQIIQHYSFVKASDTPVQVTTDHVTGLSLTERLDAALMRFRPSDYVTAGGVFGEQQLIGALAGYLTASLPGATVVTDERIASSHAERGDVVIHLGAELAILEIKRGKATAKRVSDASDQMSRYLSVGNATVGMVIFMEGSSQTGEWTLTSEYPFQESSAFVFHREGR